MTLLSLQDNRRRNQGLLQVEAEVAWGSGICLQSSSQNFLEKQQWSNLKCSKLLTNKLDLLGVKLLKNLSIDLDDPAHFWSTYQKVWSVHQKQTNKQNPHGSTLTVAKRWGQPRVWLQQKWRRDITEPWDGRTSRHTLPHRCLLSTSCGMK